MEESGVLNSSQANKLRESLSGFQSNPSTNGLSRKRTLVWLGILALALVLLSGTLFLSTTGDTPQIQNVAKTLNEVGGLGVMNKSLSTVLTFGLILIIPLLVWIWLHNALVSKEEDVLSSWAQVESNYQRRSDLIPALVDTVSRYLKHEKETLKEVTTQRSFDKAGDIINKLVDAQKGGADLLKSIAGKPPADDSVLNELSAVQGKIGLGMRQLIAVVEDYPDLRSSEQFVALQAQLEGTENRINIARMRFNESVNLFNSAIRKVPGNLVASVGGFVRKAYFQADEGANNAKPLDFK